MKKIKIFLVCVLTLATAALSPLICRADPPKNEKTLRCAVIGDTEYSGAVGIKLPSDASPIGDKAKTPVTEGGRGAVRVELGGNMFFRTTFPADSDSIMIKYDLTQSVKEVTGEADSDSESADDVTEKDSEEKDEPTLKPAVIDKVALLGVYVSAGAVSDSGTVSAELCFVSDDGNEYISRAEMDIGKPYVIYADTASVEGSAFESAYLRIYRDATVQKSLSVMTSLPSVTESCELSFLERCSLLTLTCHEGILELAEDTVTVGTDTSDVRLSLLPEEKAEDDKARTAFLSICCEEGEGTVSAVSADSTSTDSTHAVFPGSGLIPVKAVRTGNSSIELRLRSSGEERLILSEVKYYSTDEAADSLGSFTTLTYSDGVLSATGKLKGDIVSAYPDAAVGLFTEPVTGSGDPVLLGEIKMTSRFSFSVSLSKHPHAHTDNTYFVGIITDDSIIKATKSRFVSAKSVSLPTGSALALHGANPISVYESGVDNILVDVDLAKLITGASASSTTLSRGGYIYGIDTVYLRKLDSDINFYRSIGVSVYVRLLCSETMRSASNGEWLTYQGVTEGEYMLSAGSAESLNIYPAVASFLSQRYSNIASFVLSSGVNSKALTGITHRTAWDSASDIAIIAHLVYSASSEFIPSVTVTVPLVLTGNSIYAPAEMFSALLSEKLASIGNIPWCLMYTAEGDSPSVLCENIKSSARLNSGSSPLFFTVFYKADAALGDSTAAYESYCDACNASSVKVVFLSVEETPGVLSRKSYSNLKNYGSTKDSFTVEAPAEGAEILKKNGITEYAPLWDFTSTYSPEGWNAGYGMTSVVSASSLTPDRIRTLRCITDPSSPAGIFLCSLDFALSLKNAPYAEFVFELDASEDTDIIFIFGNDSVRAEFPLGELSSYEKDGKLHAVCDLTEYSAMQDVGYVGVIVYSSESITLELSQVNIYSKTLDRASIAELLKAPTEEAKNDIPAELIVAGGLGIFAALAVSVKIGTVFAKRDEKNKEVFKVVKKRRF